MIYWELTRIIAMDVNQLIPKIITHTSWDWRCICGSAQNARSVHYLCPRSAILKCKPAEYCLKPYVFAMHSKSQGMPEKKGFQEMSGIQTISEIKQHCYARIRHLCISCQTNRPKPMLWKCWKIGRITGSTITKSCPRKSCDVELEFKMNG